MEFTFDTAINIVCKQGVVDNVCEYTQGYGEKALILAGQLSMKKSGFLGRVQKSLEGAGVKVSICEGVPAEPTVNNVEEIVLTLTKGSIDYIVALGGGSVMDTAKAISVKLSHPGHLGGYFRSRKNREEITQNVIPIIAVPSTAGSGSETSRYLVLGDTENRVKDVIDSPYLIPRLCLLDPELTMNLPRRVTVLSGLDVLGHSVEGYLSKKASPITDSIAVMAIELVLENLGMVVDDSCNIEARTSMAVASALAGIVISEAGTVIGHGTAHSWGGFANLPHGLAVGALLPWVISFNRDGAQAKLARLASRLGISGADHCAKIDRLLFILEELYRVVSFDWQEAAGYLRDIPIEEIAAIAMKQPVTLLNPVAVTQQDIERELKSLRDFKGKS